MPQLADALSNMLGRPVIDRTGYSGTFDLHLEFTFEGMAGLGGGGFSAPALPADVSGDSSKPTIFSALQQQPGLRLEAQKGPAEILVIDRAERASAN